MGSSLKYFSGTKWENTFKAAFLSDRTINAIVDSLPPAVSGKSYYLTTDSKVYVCTKNIYYSFTPPEWSILVLRSTGETYQVTDDHLVKIPTPVELKSEIDSLTAPLIDPQPETVAYFDIDNRPSLTNFTQVARLLNGKTTTDEILTYIGATKQSSTEVNILSYGAMSGTDITATLQNCVNDLHDRGGGSVNIPLGVWKLSATIIKYNNVDIIGAGGTKTLIQRDGSYGDTFYQEGGFCYMAGLFLQHGTNNPTDNVPLDYMQTNGSSHIKLVDTQNALIRDCILWRMPFGIISDGGHNTRIENSWVQGVWDRENPLKQEGIADIYFAGSNRHGQLGKVLNCYLSGAPGPVRATTYSDGTHSVTSTQISNVGSKANIFVQSLEDLDLSGTYLGRASYDLLLVSPAGPHGIIADIRVNHCLFDDAGDGISGHQILVNANEVGKFVLGMSVVGSTFNGEYDTNNAVLIAANSVDSKASVVGLTFSGNVLFAHTATPVVLFGANIANISGNTISNWNSKNAALQTTPNLTYKSPIYVGPLSKNVTITSNTLGGGGNEGLDVGNFCYGQVFIDRSSVGSVASNNTYTGIVSPTGIIRGVTNLESQFIDDGSDNIQLPQGVSYYERVRTAAGASVVNLPKNPPKGAEIVVKDGAGNASASTLIIGTGDSSLIDGLSSTNIIEPYGHIHLRFNGIQWRRVG